MTAASKLPAVLDYLVTTFTNAATIGGTGVLVRDGPTLDQVPAQQVLWVGLDDPNSTDDALAGNSEQEWVGPGSRWKNETLTIPCVAEAWSDGVSVKTMRDAAYAIVNAAEQLLHDDASLGGLISPGHANMTGGELRQAQTEQGLIVRVAFQIICTEVRIGV